MDMSKFISYIYDSQQVYIFSLVMKVAKDEQAQESVGLMLEETMQTRHEVVEFFSWWSHNRYF